MIGYVPARRSVQERRGVLLGRAGGYLGLIVGFALTSGCGQGAARAQTKRCKAVVIWNATGERIKDAMIYIGDVTCPGGSVSPGRAAKTMGFAIQRYGAARIAWTTKDGMKHERIIDLKQTLPGSVGGAEVWFRIGDDRVEVVVRGPGKPAPNVREEQEGNEKKGLIKLER